MLLPISVHEIIDSLAKSDSLSAVEKEIMTAIDAIANTWNTRQRPKVLRESCCSHTDIFSRRVAHQKSPQSNDKGIRKKED